MMSLASLSKQQGRHIATIALAEESIKETSLSLYIGDEEIAVFKEGDCKELKITDATRPIAIEIDKVAYAPIVDVQGVNLLSLSPYLFGMWSWLCLPYLR